MATIEEVYNEFMAANEDVRAQMLEGAKTPEGLSAMLAERGCDATPEEFAVYLKERAAANGELVDSELSSVSGGCGEISMRSFAGMIVGLFC